MKTTMYKEDEMQQEAIDLMDDINNRLGTNHCMSLDEFYDEFSYQFTDDEEERFEELLWLNETVCRNGKDWDKCNCC